MHRRLFAFLAVLLFPGLLFAGLPARFHDIAQVGDGGGFRTVFLIENQNAQAATVTLRFFKDDGSPLSLNVGGGDGVSFTTVIPPGGMKKLSTAGVAAAPQVGWAQLSSTVEVGAEVLFELFSSGRLVAQAAVESPGPVDLFDLFVDQADGGSTGVALANLSAVGSVRILFVLRDENGVERASRTISLPALGHVAQFVSELFPASAGLRGTLHVEASGPVTVVALQQTGGVLATLPVVEVFS